MQNSGYCELITMTDKPDPKFQPGHAKTPGSGRPQGSRTRLSNALLSALAEDFEVHGPTVIKIVRIEEPATYLRVIASLLPKEFAINDAKLGDMSDEEISALLATVREMRAQTASAEQQVR